MHYWCHLAPCAALPPTAWQRLRQSSQVLERIKDPLMTLVSRDHHETAHAVLAHFLIIAQRAPLIFASVRMAHAPSAKRGVNMTLSRSTAFT